MNRQVDLTSLEAELEPPTLILPRGRLSAALRRLANLLPGVELEAEREVHRGRLLPPREWAAWQRRWREFFEEILRAELEGSEMIPLELEDRWDELLRAYLVDLRFSSRAITYVEGLPGGPQLEVVQEINAAQARAAAVREN